MTTGKLSAAAGGKISVMVKFSEAVRLGTTGSPATFPQYIDLTFGTVIRRATYESSDGTDTIVFSYTLVPADRAPTGVRLAGLINLGGSTLRDLVGNNATVTLRTPLKSLPIFTA